jgi:hypothetical protein
MPAARLWLAPELPTELGDLTLERVSLAGARMTVTVAGGVVQTQGLPPGVQLIADARPAVVPSGTSPSTDRTP